MEVDESRGSWQGMVSCVRIVLSVYHNCIWGLYDLCILGLLSYIFGDNGITCYMMLWAGSLTPMSTCYCVDV